MILFNQSQLDLQAFLKYRVNLHVQDMYLKTACFYVLNDERYFVAPASTSYHHVYVGGLATHVKEVLTYALNMASFMNADFQVLTVAAIFHDYMKVRDYTTGVEGYEKTPYAKLIHHIHGGYGEFCRLAGNVPQPLHDAISHVLLSHHGRQDWGSQIEPHTKEAYIFHFADMLSAMRFEEIVPDVAPNVAAPTSKPVFLVEEKI